MTQRFPTTAAAGILAASMTLPACALQETDGLDGEAASAEVHQALTTCVAIQRDGTGVVGDTYISSTAPGQSGAGSYTSLYSGFSDGGEKQSLLHFDLSAIPEGSTVESATFSIFQTYKTVDSTVRIHRVTAPWDEATANWSSIGGSHDPAVAGSFVSGGGFGLRDADVTALVQSWVSGAVSNHGLLLEEDLVVKTTFRSSETPTVADRPSLDVCYTDPPPSCTHPSAATLAAADPSGIADIVFGPDCRAYLSTVISGTDYVYVMDASGASTIITGHSNYNIPAIALDPTTGAVVVGHNDNGTSSVGIQSGSHISPISTGTYVSGSMWSNYYLNQCESSIAVDADGCAWTPNFQGNGTLVCVSLASGAKTTLATLPARIEGVAVDAAGALFASAGANLYAVDKTTGATTLHHAAGASIRDFAIDENGDIYVETAAGAIVLVPAQGAPSVFAQVSGQGKLAISPDGFLVRVIPNPVGQASYQEWPLGS